MTRDLRLGLARAAAILLLGIPSGADAAPVASSVSASPDVAVQLGATAQDAADHDVALDDLAGTAMLADLGTLPHASDVSGYEESAGGDQLLCFDTAVELPGSVFAQVGDVVRYDGANYSITFDASANGVPDGAQCDGVAELVGALFLSFDVTVELPDGAGGTITANDEDAVWVTGPARFVLQDASLLGVPSQLDADGFDLLANGDVAVSFDTSGEVGGVVFQDEDVLYLESSTSTWSLFYDASAQDPGWAAADVDAVALPEPGLLLVLASGIAGLHLIGRARMRP